MGIKIRNLFLIYFIFAISNSQDNDFVSYKKGIALYNEGKYSKASGIFYSLKEKKTQNGFKNISTIFLAKSLTSLGNDNESIKILENYRKNNNEFLDEAYLTLSINYYHLSEFSESIDFLNRFIENQSSKSNKMIYEELLNDIICNQITFNEVEQEIKKYKETGIFSALNFYKAKKYFLINQFSFLEEFLKNKNNEKNYLTLAQEYLKNQYQNEAKFAIFLPLFLKNDSILIDKTISNEILEGAIFAAEEKNKTLKNKIKLEIIDTEHKPSKVASDLQKFADDKNIFGILGPVFSDETKILGAMASKRKIPLISPTASDTGIAKNNKYVFQLNPDLETRGKIAAKFAIEKLNLETFAIFAPSNLQQKIISDAFANEIISNNKIIVADVRYPKNTVDLRYYLNLLRKNGIIYQSEYFINTKSNQKNNDLVKKLKTLNLNDETISKLISDANQISLSSIFKNKTKLIADSIKIPLIKKQNNLDSLEYPIKSIDAVFIPINLSKEISGIISQFKLYNIETIFIGSAEWYNEEILEQNIDEINDLYFTTNHFKNDDDLILLNNLKKKINHAPTQNNLIGYNMIEFISENMDFIKTKEDFYNHLLKGINFKGKFYDVKIDESRRNQKMKIVRFNKDGFKKIDF